MKSLLLLVVLGIAYIQPSHAATISLFHDGNAVTAGETFEIDIRFDFTEPVIGGGIDFTYSNALAHLDSFSFNADFQSLLDPFLTSPGHLVNNRFVDLGFGEFFGISGQHTVGTFRFTALSDGLFEMGPTANASGIVGPFVSANSFSAISVMYSSIALNIAPLVVTPPNIPVSAPPIMFLFIIVTVLFFRRNYRMRY